MSKRKLRPGPNILSIDEVAAQELIFFHGKVYHYGWFQSWQLRMFKNCVGPKGCIRYAMPAREKVRFSDEDVLRAARMIHGNVSRQALEHTIEVLKIWDDGSGSVEDIAECYKGPETSLGG